MTTVSAVRHWTGILLLATENMSDQPFPITAIGRHRTFILFKRARDCVADPKDHVLPASEPAIRIQQKKRKIPTRVPSVFGAKSMDQ